MNTTRIAFLAVMLVGLLAVGVAFAEKISKSPGYFDLEWIQIPDDAEEVQDIDLKAALKGLAADAKESGDDEFAQLLGLIKSVRVKGYSVDKYSVKETEDYVKKSRNMLEDQGWERMIYVKDDEETVTVSTKSVGDDMVGLMVVAYEPGEEASFVNVVGDLDLAYLIGLAGKLHGENLEAFLEDLDIEGVEVHVHDD